MNADTKEATVSWLSMSHPVHTKKICQNKKTKPNEHIYIQKHCFNVLSLSSTIVKQKTNTYGSGVGGLGLGQYKCGGLELAGRWLPKVVRRSCGQKCCWLMQMLLKDQSDEN